MMQSLHVEADTWMHRRSPRLKLVILALLGVLLFLTDNLLLLTGAVAIGGLLYFTTGMGFGAAMKRLRPVLLTILFVAAFTLLFNPLHLALVSVLRLTTLMLFAATVTATTTISAFVDEVTVLATPLEKLGLMKAADIGLAIGLVLRFVPEILNRYEAIREAHAARGLTVRVRTVLVPLIILTLRDADNIAAAIDARGIRGH